MHFLLHSKGSGPCEEPSFHSLTLSPTGYIPSGRCRARSRRIPHSWRGRSARRGSEATVKKGARSPAALGPGGKGRTEERKNGARPRGGGAGSLACGRFSRTPTRREPPGMWPSPPYSSSSSPSPPSAWKHTRASSTSATRR